MHKCALMQIFNQISSQLQRGGVASFGAQRIASRGTSVHMAPWLITCP